jgi:S-adenosylmethionine decarboxylase proenzyme
VEAELNNQPVLNSVPPANVDYSASHGTHYLLDLFGCSSPILDDELGLVALAAEAAAKAGATVLATHHHRFEPHGVSAICVLAESHLSIHTWPEIGTATIDVYTCGDSADPNVACDLIEVQLAPQYAERTRIDRGRPSATRR